MAKRICAFLCALVLVFAFSACGEGGRARELYVMDSVASLAVFPENAEALDEMTRGLFELDRAFSAYDGELFETNENGGGRVSRHIAELFSQSKTFFERTRGAFSPSLGAVIELWGIGSENYVPTKEERAAALASSDIKNVELSGVELRLSRGAKLNFGAIAKGYAADVLKNILLEKNIESALISLGGNVYVHGSKPDKSAWNVAIRDPAGGAGDWLGSLALTDKFVISSGDYERFFERDGKRYHHIIDPATGNPAESDLTAVCVVCENGTMGDAYSTALYVMGREGALEFWKENEGFELVLVGRDGRVTVTEGIADVFSPNEGKGYTYETAYR